jgi:preprotein translocase subunit SecF
MIELVKPGTNIDFIGRRRLCALLSVGLLAASVIAIPIRGVRLGIDFAGGTEIQVKFAPEVEASEGPIREVLGVIDGVDNASVVRYGDAADNEFLIRFKGDINPTSEGTGDRVELIKLGLSGAVGPPVVQRVEFVGPRVGEELRKDGLLALFWASIVILVYIAFRFSSRFAPGAIVAVLHDISITAGIFVILGMEFDLRILAAMLAILGYSLNDTIIIYDRIRENLAVHTKVDLPEVLNLSVNQTLSRTVLTSATTLLALGSLFLLGGEVIRPFAFAMIIGVLVGTYSSVYIASPTLLLLEQRLGGVAGDAKKKA